jgi:hypothetical protein
MKRLSIAFLLAMTLLLPGLGQASAQDDGSDSVAFSNGEAYLYAAWIEFEGETASSLFDYFIDPVSLDIWFGSSLEDDFEDVERDGVVGGQGWTTGFRWDLTYNDVPGESWIIPAEGKVYWLIILDENLGKGDDSYKVYFDFLRESVAMDGLPDAPERFTAVEEDPQCVGNGQLHPFCPFEDLIAS